jgi:hypothetical protein
MCSASACVRTFLGVTATYVKICHRTDLRRCKVSDLFLCSGRAAAADSTVTDAQSSSHKATALSADDLLPLLSFVVVCAYKLQAQPLRHLRAQIEFVDALLPAHMKLGQTGELQPRITTS